MLEATRQAIARLEKARAEGTAKSEVISSLKQWADTMQPPPGRANRNSQAAMNQAAAKSVIGAATARLDTQSLAESLTLLRAWERTLGANAPAK